MGPQAVARSVPLPNPVYACSFPAPDTLMHAAQGILFRKKEKQAAEHPVSDPSIGHFRNPESLASGSLGGVRWATRRGANGRGSLRGSLCVPIDGSLGGSPRGSLGGPPLVDSCLLLVAGCLLHVRQTWVREVVGECSPIFSSRPGSFRGRRNAGANQLALWLRYEL